MTTQFENEKTLTVEKDAVNRFVRLAYAGCHGMKLIDKKHGVDYAIVDPDGYIVAFIEIKGRSAMHTMYETWNVSMTKVHRMFELAQNTGLPVFLGFRWKDGLWFTQITRPQYLLRWGGRGDVRVPMDVEPMACLNPIDFTCCFEENLRRYATSQ